MGAVRDGDGFGAQGGPGEEGDGGKEAVEVGVKDVVPWTLLFGTEREEVRGEVEADFGFPCGGVRFRDVFV